MDCQAQSVWQPAGPIPACAGIGLRAVHQADIIAQRPAIDWFEIHTENYFAEGGGQREALHAIREDYRLSFHGVGLSLGSSDMLSRPHLEATKELIERFEPALISEHLSWSSVDGNYLNDLLPLPYSRAASVHVSEKIQQCQDYLQREIMIENVSCYVQFAAADMSEWDFLMDVVVRAGCKILLDINNIYVNARNHGFDPFEYIDAIPPGLVQEFHLAGHQVNHDGAQVILIDTHASKVCPAVWELYRYSLERIGPRPTLIEWDADIPALEILTAEAAQAASMLDSVR